MYNVFHTLQVSLLTQQIRGTYKMRMTIHEYIATLGSNLDSESKLCSDESQSGL